jgi:hypothetical protein
MPATEGTRYVFRSLEHKLKLLQLWLTLDLNGGEWERQTGIERSYLRYWARVYGDKVPGLKEAMEEKGLKPKPKQLVYKKRPYKPRPKKERKEGTVVPEANLMPAVDSDRPIVFSQNDMDYSLIRCEMLVRIRELIRRTNNIKMLAESLKIITEVEKHTKGKGKDSPEGEVPASNIFNVIMANIEKSKQDGTQSD